MARANIYTWLPLDDWAKRMGYNRYHFNGIVLPDCNAGVSCGNIWYQYPEQSGAVSREELAAAIRYAEDTLSRYVNYNLFPDWHSEILYPSNYYHLSYQTTRRVGGYPKTVQTSKRKFIAGGQRAKTLIGTDTLTFFDRDNDGFNESARIALPTDVDISEVRLYYPDKEAADEWEIRPFTTTSTHIIIPVWLLVKPELIEENCIEPLDGAGDIYLTDVDVYRVYNDTSQTQVRLIYPPSCNECEETYTTSCLTAVDHRLGHVTYNPYNLTEPHKLEVFYCSGHQRGRTLDPFWEAIIAILACAYLDKKPCNCCDGNECQYVSQWMDQLDKVEKGKPSFQTTIRILENEFGIANRGAWHALRQSYRSRIV